MNTIRIQTSRYQCRFYSNGVIYHLSIDNSENLIPQNNGWGCELGNWLGAFNQRKHLTRSTLVKQTDNREFHFEFPVTLPKDSLFYIREKLTFDTTAIIQQFTFTVISPRAFIGDLVNRFVFREDIFLFAGLGDKRFTHRSSNIYHQVPLRDIKLRGEQLGINIEKNEIFSVNRLSKSFEKVIYVRDEPITNESQPAWVIHSRLLASLDGSNDCILRWFYPNFLPPQFFKQAITNIKPLKKTLWSLRERWPLSPAQLGGIVATKKNDSFMLKSRISFTNYQK